MNAVRTVVAGGLAGLLAGGAAIAAMTAVPASAASLQVDGGVLQVFVIDDLPDVSLPPDLPVQFPAVAVAPAQPRVAVAPQPQQRPDVSAPAAGPTAPGNPAAPDRPAAPEGPAEPSPPAEPVEKSTVRYEDCTAARDAGAAPLAAEDPGYRAELDPDADGVACAADELPE